jgi:hypothetical protein
MATPVIDVQLIGMLWRIMDPFLFCAYHHDTYPPRRRRRHYLVHHFKTSGPMEIGGTRSGQYAPVVLFSRR